MPDALLPDVAAKVAEWFPEFGGRSLAVSEVDVNRENLPTLPLVMVALVRSDVNGNWNWKSPSAQQQLYDDFVIDFWLEPVIIPRADGSQTPFWAFYNYEPLRNRLLTKIRRYIGPSKQRLEFREMTIDAEPFAVTLSFRFRGHFDWCPDEDDEPGDGQIIGAGTIKQSLCAPASTVCSPCFSEPAKECNPCPSSE